MVSSHFMNSCLKGVLLFCSETITFRRFLSSKKSSPSPFPSPSPSPSPSPTPSLVIMNSDSHLYLLATDESFAEMPNLVWERFDQVCDEIRARDIIIKCYDLLREMGTAMAKVIESFRIGMGTRRRRWGWGFYLMPNLPQLDGDCTFMTSSLDPTSFGSVEQKRAAILRSNSSMNAMGGSGYAEAVRQQIPYNGAVNQRHRDIQARRKKKKSCCIL